MKQKDWMLDAAKEIGVKLVGDDRDDARIAAIIAKHHSKIVRETGHVWDWAARCGAYLHAEGMRIPSHRIAAVVAFFAEPLVKLLREAKQVHDHVNDGVCCPRCCCQSWPDDPEGDFEPTPNGDEPCTCGADAWNAKIDAVLQGEEP